MPQTDCIPQTPDEDRSSRQSFVLRVWLEGPARPDEGAPWRGRIIHVGSSEECYTGDLDRICEFIAGYLDRMGARLPVPRRIGLWLRRRRRGAEVARR